MDWDIEQPTLKEFATTFDDYADNYLQCEGEFHPNWHTVRDNKFAELIIQECVRISEEDPVGDDPACCTNTSYRIARTIKKHFGIE